MYIGRPYPLPLEDFCAIRNSHCRIHEDGSSIQQILLIFLMYCLFASTVLKHLKRDTTLNKIAIEFSHNTRS